MNPPDTRWSSHPEASSTTATPITALLLTFFITSTTHLYIVSAHSGSRLFRFEKKESVTHI